MWLLATPRLGCLDPLARRSEIAIAQSFQAGSETRSCGSLWNYRRNTRSSTTSSTRSGPMVAVSMQSRPLNASGRMNREFRVTGCARFLVVRRVVTRLRRCVVLGTMAVVWVIALLYLVLSDIHHKWGYGVGLAIFAIGYVQGYLFIGITCIRIIDLQKGILRERSWFYGRLRAARPHLRLRIDEILFCPTRRGLGPSGQPAGYGIFVVQCARSYFCVWDTTDRVHWTRVFELCSAASQLRRHKCDTLDSNAGKS